MERYGVIIVDEHDLVRSGVSLILQAQDDLEVLAEASSADDALPLSAECRPDAVCLATRFSHVDGFDLVRRLRGRLDPRVAIVLLGSARDGDCAQRALDAGADAFVSKGAEPAVIVDAVRDAAARARGR